jgi:predicted RNA polymerase sigma factor
MDNITRDALDGAIRVMDNWLHNGELDKPTWAMLTAMQTAIDAMRREQRRTALSYDQPCAVLRYHINQPTALLFRDPVTLRTIRTGIAVMERQYKQRP